MAVVSVFTTRSFAVFSFIKTYPSSLTASVATVGFTTAAFTDVTGASPITCALAGGAISALMLMTDITNRDSRLSR